MQNLQSEKEYKWKLSPQEVNERKNDDSTTEIVESIRTKLYKLLANGNEVNSDFMLNALNYLRTFCEQIFGYRNDDEWIINTAVFNTFIEIYKQLGFSFRDYFCQLKFLSLKHVI